MCNGYILKYFYYIYHMVFVHVFLNLSLNIAGLDVGYYNCPPEGDARLCFPLGTLV